MSKNRTVFFCTDCGNETPRWEGQCPACGAWNTLVKEPDRPGRGTARPVRGARQQEQPIRLSAVDSNELLRWPSGLEELDFVLGGGVVPGSLVLVGGDPGIGKSTLLLQLAARLEAGGRTTLYVSGEESPAQVRLRAERLGPAAAEVRFLAATELDAILDCALGAGVTVLVLDSIQTTQVPELDAAPGSINQLRECALRVHRFAKENGVAVFLVGHVTKGGEVAGPRSLEHIVDTVLYFEGLGGSDQRVLRATKNRFGSVDEIGIFRMTAGGLDPVANPSELFLGERADGTGGGAVVPTMEGSRPLLVEVQVLCAPASFGAPQRVATGLDRQRLAVLLAVLEARAGLPGFGQLDVFLKVVGGARLSEPAADLAVAAALAGAALGVPVPGDAVFLAEIGLNGELRPPYQVERRLGEAARMGFARALLPRQAVPKRLPAGLEPVPLEKLAHMVRWLREP